MRPRFGFACLHLGLGNCEGGEEAAQKQKQKHQHQELELEDAKRPSGQVASLPVAARSCRLTIQPASCAAHVAMLLTQQQQQQQAAAAT
ncbi:hypothetical protein M5D96_007000 [Drosophila gunungcola]|uniref:Uncharacterized protein n=1 Tax=Drosophila gunungcola TaxID=103775 RepID=A0A9P9YMC1_9MUSC|nr:hypothetical protein M5D96_007000 [Drosophila gunungcola]